MNSENVIVAVITGVSTYFATQAKSRYDVKRQEIESDSTTEGIYVENMTAILAEIKGIQGHFKELKDSSIEKFTRKQLSKGVKVDTREDGIYIDIYCSLSYGINISETAKTIQSTIFNSVTTMTTIEPSQINVHITHIEPTN